MPLSYAAICFDLDGTLVDSEGDAADAIELALAPLHRVLRKTERDYVLGHGMAEIHALIQTGGGVPWSYAEFEEAVFAARLVLAQTRGVCVLPGAREVVAKLARHFPLALVTGSTRKEAEWLLDELGIRACFSVSCCSGEYPAGKPSPWPYLSAAQSLGVPPSHCVAAEDSEAGILSARGAGMRCAAIAAGNRFNQDQTQADWIFPTLNDFADLVLKN